MNINGARILVTGGCGLIGSTTIEQLLRDHDPARIVILDNLVRGSLANVTQALNDPRVTLLRGDIRDRRHGRARHRGHGRGDAHGRAAHHRLRRRPA